MKTLLLFVLTFFISTNLFAKNPIDSPTFEDLIKQIIGNQKYIFDDENIQIKVPNFADNPVQVPIYVNASKIKDAQRMIIFADLNPIPRIVDMQTTKILPIISTNIKVAQETPLRALILDSKGIWHIGSKNIRSNGGGCDVSSQASTNSDFAKFLGKTKGKVFEKKDKNRIKASIFHPMETGLIFGNVEFYINTITIKNDKEILSTIKTSSAISENPRFIFETQDNSKSYKMNFLDNDGNDFELEL
ncbi:quinoprotein dehydrogenase-associated SoxYZ-like carrier [Arcobacter sp. YIC-464]|uniref:quinoprotein dehydrogenase-associated SoxYZ-like carrier n=1 Tax=Arcobacter sp. YIC-464 TaxID=3376631 RepID=UPI003C23FE31